MECRICKENKSPYKFDGHILGPDWGKAEECRACTEIARHDLRKRVHEKNKKIIPKAPLITKDRYTSCCDGCGKLIFRCGCRDSDFEGNEDGTITYKPNNMVMGRPNGK